MAELHDLAAPYALDALDERERAVFEAHLEACAACRSEVAELVDSAGLLADHVAVRPPVEMKDRVMRAMADRAADEPVSVEVTRLARYRRPVLVVAAAAAVVVAVAAVVAGLSPGGAPSVADILAAPDATTVELTSDGVQASFTYSIDEGHGVFRSDSLPPLSEAEVYELWLIDESGPSPAGLFAPGSDGITSVVVARVRPGITLGVTVEPAGGSDRPTGEIVLSAAIG